MRTVIKWDDCNLRDCAVTKPLFWQTSLYFFNFLFNVVDNSHRIVTIASHNDAAHSLLPLLIKSATPFTRAERNMSHVLHPDAYAIRRRNCRILQILKSLNISQPTNLILYFIQLQRPSPNINIRVFHSKHDVN